jgi:NDP-sugar pyrophosphorylase family protein
VARIKHALIMAAGRGQRMMPLTAVVPKAMAPYNGSTLVGENIRQVRKYIEHIYITVGYQGAVLAQHVIEHGVSAIFNTEGQSNCWWVYNTLLKNLDAPMFVLTCDNVVELDFNLLETDYFNCGEPACMIVPVKPVPGLDGDYIFHQDNVVIKLDRHKKSDVYCSGIQILNPSAVNRLTHCEGDFYSLWGQLIARQQVMISRVYPKNWFSADTMDQLTELNNRGHLERR